MFENMEQLPDNGGVTPETLPRYVLQPAGDRSSEELSECDLVIWERAIGDGEIEFVVGVI